MRLFVVLAACLVEIIQCEPQAFVPTKQELTDVLGNVQEVFVNLKNIVDDETIASDASVVEETDMAVGRAKKTLSLVEELALLKLVCAVNDDSEDDAKARVQNTIQKGYIDLEKCTKTASQEIRTISERVRQDATSAASHGQNFIDTLLNCSKKPVLLEISCYRRVMVNDVFPLKETLLKAIQSHKSGHVSTKDVRKLADNCVDNVLKSYQEKIAKILGNV